MIGHMLESEMGAAGERQREKLSSTGLNPPANSIIAQHVKHAIMMDEKTFSLYLQDEHHKT